MSFFRTNKRELPFAQIDRGLLDDKRLSWQEKGLLCYLLSKPEGWKTVMADLEKRSTNGRTSVQGIIKGLIEAGYIKRKPNQNEDGTLNGWIYDIYEFPQTAQQDNRLTGNPPDGEHAPSNKEYSNNELSNTPIVPKGDESESPEEKDSSTVKEDPIPYDEIVKAWNACEAFASMRGMNSNRKRTLRARWKNPDFRDGWKEALAAAHRSPFLRGEVKPSAGYRQFRMTFDWFINERNFQKIIEGNFDDQSSKPYTPEPLNRDQRDWYAENGKAQEYLDRRTDADERAADKKYFFEKHGLTLN